jgi:hypothetical protein
MSSSRGSFSASPSSAAGISIPHLKEDSQWIFPLCGLQGSSTL